MPNKSTDYIASLAKGLRVLECFGADAPKLAVSDIAGMTELDRASARRCLLTLHQEGYLDYDGKHFTPTTRVLRLGTGTLAALPTPQIVQPWLDQLSARIGQSVSFSILDDTEIVYLARAAQQRVIAVGLMPGARLPAHCTSMGRVLLAALPTEKAQSILEASDLTPHTRFSKTDLSEILNALQSARDQGYALVDQELELGLRSLAVPIQNSRGETVAALNVGVAAVHDRAEEIKERFLEELLRVQAGLRKLLQ